MKAPDVAIIGLGLMGGSLARALRRKKLRVLGVDRAPVVRKARAAGAIHAAATDPRASLAAPLVVLAAPPQANLALLRRLGPIAPPRAVLTDLGSVKSPIAHLARRLGLKRFVGGHPMTGSERAGFGASTPDLFRGHPWILTPNGCDPQALASVRRLVRVTGARPFSMPPGEHDRVIAFLSHMPQLLSWAIDGAARRDPVALRHLHLAGPGFRDMTRLARSSRTLWREILAQNEREIGRAMAALEQAMKRRV